jgi:cytochrome c-type protein NapC
MTKRKKLLKFVSVVSVLLILMVVSWMTLEMGVEVSSHADFCGVCHSMEPMVKAYRASTHGGNNPRGIMAACTDCHVSHENVFTHFIGKAKSGTHDAWVTLIRDESELDWQSKRLEHNEYVYDSGCLTCHRNLEKASYDNPKAFIAHKAYFSGDTKKQCVTCHEHVGHKDISDYISQK